MYPKILTYRLFFIPLDKQMDMDTLEILNRNVDLLCAERGWSHKRLAKEMAVEESALSRTLSSNPRLTTLEKIAKALDVSIKSLFEDQDAIEGFVSVKGRIYRINSREEFDRIVGRTAITIKTKAPGGPEASLQ